jgi:hypothetical protein
MCHQNLEWRVLAEDREGVKIIEFNEMFHVKHCAASENDSIWDVSLIEPLWKMRLPIQPGRFSRN